MAKTGRLIRGELNKILMRPILYIITGILVVALIFSLAIFKPVERGESDFNIKGDTVAELVTNFNSSAGSANKKTAQDYVSNSQVLLNYYSDLNQDEKGSLTNSLIKIMDTAIAAFGYYDANLQNTATPSVSNLKVCRQELEDTLSNLQQSYNQVVNQTNPSVLVQKAQHEELIRLLTLSLKTVRAEGLDQNLVDTHVHIHGDFVSGNYLNKMNKIVRGIKDITIPLESLELMQDKINATSVYMLELEAEINSNSIIENFPVADLRSLMIKYCETGHSVYQYTVDTIKLKSLSGFNDSAAHQLMGYENVYKYQLQENIALNAYLLDNNKSISEFATMLNPTVSSNATPNGFDFIYFGLEICTFIIIIFCIVLAATMIAGEYSNGTLKQLTIRPYSRNKILSSKVWATLIFGLIFLLFCLIILCVMGFAMYGFNLTPIIAVFNATSVFTVSPIVMLLIYVACLIIKILLYTLMGIALSTIFRSNVAAVCVSVFLFFFAILFTALFAGSYWYAFLPFSNFDLFKYFGGSFIPTGSNPMAFLFTSPIMHNMNILISGIISAVFAALMIIISHVTFNKREIK